MRTQHGMCARAILIVAEQITPRSLTTLQAAASTLASDQRRASRSRPRCVPSGGWHRPSPRNSNLRREGLRAGADAARLVAGEPARDGLPRQVEDVEIRHADQRTRPLPRGTIPRVRLRRARAPVVASIVRSYPGGNVAADSQKEASASMTAQKRSKSPALTT